MKTILIIGIGAGDPDYITVQAIKALNRDDVFFLMDKGPAKVKLRAARERCSVTTSCSWRSPATANPKTARQRMQPDSTSTSRSPWICRACRKP